MANPGAAEPSREYSSVSRAEFDESLDSSDDSEVSVANLTGNRNEEAPVEVPVEAAEEESEKEHDEATSAEARNETGSEDEYAYSDDSLCSDDSCGDSDVTNVTRRSSLSVSSPMNRAMSLEFPRREDEEEIAGTDGTRGRFENRRGHFRQACLSAKENRSSIVVEPRGDTIDPSRGRRRRNMSFTNAEMRKIELENQYLLKKIMSHQRPTNKPIRVMSAQPKTSSSAINRRKFQKKIEEDNMMLLRRIQEAKSCALSTKAIPGYRLTSL